VAVLCLPLNHYAGKIISSGSLSLSIYIPRLFDL
jgi:hypothetical protein